MRSSTKNTTIVRSKIRALRKLQKSAIILGFMRKLLLRVTLATLTLCMPIQAFGAVLLQADDTIAGLSAEITGRI